MNLHCIMNMHRLTLSFTFIFIFTFLSPSLFAQADSQTPPNLKIAFIGDADGDADSEKVLQLIKDEGADAVIHAGDIDYNNNPENWNNVVNNILGEDFPYFLSMGNHDVKKWDGPNGSQKLSEDRMKRLGLTWDGDLGVQSSFTYKGVFIIMVAPGERGEGHDVYIKEQLEGDDSIWSIAVWHRNMEKMQVGGKDDATGWEVYEEARKGGAIIATAHEHSYSRTYCLSNMENQTIVSKSDTLGLTKGNSFVFVSGLGGKSIRDQELSGEWWASIYTSDQDANFGALFGVFNVNGVQELAEFYFKDIDGKIVDRFWVRSSVGSRVIAGVNAEGTVPTQFTLAQNYPNPFNPLTVIEFYVPHYSYVKLTVSNILGQQVRTLFDGFIQAGNRSLLWDGRDDLGNFVSSGHYFYSLTANGYIITKRLTFMK